MAARQGPRVRRGSAPGLLREAARDLFADRGYRVTTREIAERAGVSHDLIFRYFGTKEGLLLDAVLVPLLDALDGLHRHWLAHPDLRALGPDEVIHRFTRQFYVFMEENQPIAQALVHLFTEGPTDGELERVRRQIGETLAPMVLHTQTYLSEEGMRHATVALQLRVMMLLVGAVALFLPKTYPSDADSPPRELIVDELARFIAGGLKSTAALSAASKP